MKNNIQKRLLKIAINLKNRNEKQIKDSKRFSLQTEVDISLNELIRARTKLEPLEERYEKAQEELEEFIKNNY